MYVLPLAALLIGVILGFVFTVIWAKQNPAKFARLEQQVPLHPAVASHVQLVPDQAIIVDPSDPHAPPAAQAVNKTQA
jgi:hypothetical protein